MSGNIFKRQNINYTEKHHYSWMTNQYRNEELKAQTHSSDNDESVNAANQQLLNPSEQPAIPTPHTAYAMPPVQPPPQGCSYVQPYFPTAPTPAPINTPSTPRPPQASNSSHQPVPQTSHQLNPTGQHNPSNLHHRPNDVKRNDNAKNSAAPSPTVRNETPNYSEKEARRFLASVQELSKENDAIRWISKIEAKGYSLFFITTSNGEIWSETESAYGNTLCAVKSDNVIFAVPSPTDTQLRSASISAWYDIIGTGSSFKVDKLAVGKVTNNGGFIPIIKGVIRL